MTESVKTRFRNFLHHQWEKGGILSTILLPFSFLFYGVQSLRKLAFKVGLKKTYQAPCPVIIIGNIYVGGTGKTPIVLAVVQALQKKGYHVGIITRGYGTSIGPQAKTAYQQAKAHEIGDEPSFLAQFAPIGVHPKRALAVEALLEAYPQTNLIVADDGLQHLALARDIEIIVQDQRQIGNGHLLPAGPLREPAQRLNTVDFIINNLPSNNKPEYQAQHKPQGTTTKSQCFHMHLKPTQIVHLNSKKSYSIDEWKAQFLNAAHQHQLAALAGIGNPQRFFNTLKALEIKAEQYQSYPDHYQFKQEDFESYPQNLILMTEKDASKCLNFNDDRLWYLQVEAEFLEPDFFDLLEQKLKHLK